MASQHVRTNNNTAQTNNYNHVNRLKRANYVLRSARALAVSLSLLANHQVSTACVCPMFALQASKQLMWKKPQRQQQVAHRKDTCRFSCCCCCANVSRCSNRTMSVCACGPAKRRTHIASSSADANNRRRILEAELGRARKTSKIT